MDKEPVPESASLVSVNSDSIDKLIHQAGCVSSNLSKENAELLKRQACYLPISIGTGLPMIGPHSYYNELYLATGHSFWGILNAPITGKLMSEWIIHGFAQSIDKKVHSSFLPQ
jgi:glycine/D-amino acid oxidase-like deaminating enzyme